MRLLSGRVDLNHRPQRPERCALTKLRYAPLSAIIGILGFRCKLEVGEENCEILHFDN